MHFFKLLLAAMTMTMTVAAIASSASATTVKGRVITLTYSDLNTVSAPFSDILDIGDTAKLEILVTRDHVVTNASTVTTIRDTAGRIRVFDPNGNFVNMGNNGVFIQIRDNEIKFGSIERGAGAEDGAAFLALTQNHNLVSSSNGLFGLANRDFGEALAILAGGDYDGAKPLLVKTRDNGATSNSLTTQADASFSGLQGVTVSTVPLPSGVWLLLGGVGIMVLRRQRAA